MFKRFNARRRSLLAACCALPAAACSASLRKTDASSAYPKPPFDETTSFTVIGSAADIARTAHETGAAYQTRHRGCARCTVGALQDSVDFIPRDESLLRGASCLDGGATPTKLANCGAFTGAGMIFGYMSGNHTYGDTKLCHELITAIHGRFVEAYGGVLCKDVRAAVEGQCGEVVGLACRWSVELLIERFGMK